MGNNEKFTTRGASYKRPAWVYRGTGVNLCTKCGLEKPDSEFYFQKDGHTRNSGFCKPCYRECKRKYRAENAAHVRSLQRKSRRKNLAKSKHHALKSNYGISLETYEQMVALQGGLCAICKMPPSGSRKALCVDHCHETDVVRGLLCAACNSAIGLLEEDCVRMENAIAYLRSRKT